MRIKVLLVCSSGGHLLQLHRLERWWRTCDRVWVTFQTPDAVSLLAGEEVRWACHPTTRNIPNLLRNFILAVKWLRSYRPDGLTCRLSQADCVTHSRTYSSYNGPNRSGFTLKVKLSGGYSNMGQFDPRLVFVTVGTDHHPFDRLILAMERWFAEHRNDPIDCLMQVGTSRRPSLGRWVDYVPYEEMKETLRKASAVVCHGGPATIMLARYYGHIPIVVPRRGDLREHVDDHQVIFSRHIAQEGAIRLAEEEAALHQALSAALRGELRIAQDHGGQTIEAVDRFTELVNDLLT